MAQMVEAFQLVAGHLALDFANTLDNRYDAERLVELLPAYDRFLAFAVQSRIITRPQARKLLAQASKRDAKRALERVIELRETVYFLFRSVATGQRPDRACLRAFNRAFAGARVPEALVWRKSGFVRDCGDLAEKPSRPLW